MVALALHYVSRRWVVLGLSLLLPAGRAAAHAVDEAAAGGTVWAWSFEPWVIACLAISALAYALGLRRLWGEAGVGRGVSRRQAAFFVGGWLSLVLALVSPLDALGVELFSAHMIQHELLMVVAAPLLCLSRPLGLWVWALSPLQRRRLGAALRRPAWRAAWQWLIAPTTAWVLHALALWGWHVPALFDAALHTTWVHTAQHASFLVTALLFWWSLLEPRSRERQGRALLSVFTTMLHTAALGALLTLSPVVWYPAYQATSATFGLDALEDQQLGGLVMWAPGGLAYFMAALALASRWIALGAPRRPAGAHPPA